MERQKIEGSSNIAEIGYDYNKQTLEIKFNTGQVYQYWPVTRACWKLLMKSESKGKYFAEKIRKNPKINYQKVDEMQSGK